jgi:hypothetical protein
MPRRQMRVHGLAVGISIDPITVETFQSVAKMDRMGKA